MKKIMFLGGAFMQLPAIHYANKKGYYTILCDYYSDNPGRELVDEFYCISTTDKEAILNVAKKLRIDGVIAYISDPAAPTAAYVANKLNLPANPFKAVSILTKKDLFRRFLREHGFNTPKAASFKTFEVAKSSIAEFTFPLIIKPVDSSGSRGVKKIYSFEQFESAFMCALSYSREGKVIVEEFIEKNHPYQVGGDVFIKDGKIQFFGLLNCHRNHLVNPNIPVGKSYPILLEEHKIEKICNELQKLVDILGMKTGPLNVEVIFNKFNQPYLIEVAPRNGGNLIPQFLELVTGIDFVEATVEAALGNESTSFLDGRSDKYFANYTIHSSQKGILEKISFDDSIKENIIKVFFLKKIGTEIDVFDGGNKALGFVFLKFDSMAELEYKMANMSNLIKVHVHQSEKVSIN